MKLLIASRNPHKLAEIRTIFNLPGMEIVGAHEIKGLPEVLEDGLPGLGLDREDLRAGRDRRERGEERGEDSHAAD